MGEFVADGRLKEFYDREVTEIMQNKLRFGFIIACLVASVALFAFTDNETEVTEAYDNGAPKVVTASNDKSTNDKTSDKNKSDKPTSKVTSITGLERASEGGELINPFKADLVKPPIETKSPKPESIPLPQTPKPIPTKTVENSDKVVLILKGTAISGDKKMAIIQRSVVGKDNSTKSTNPKDKSKNESLLLNIGDEIDGRRIVAIDKDFVIFDDGYKLHIQEALQ